MRFHDVRAFMPWTLNGGILGSPVIHQRVYDLELLVSLSAAPRGPSKRCRVPGSLSPKALADRPLGDGRHQPFDRPRIEVTAGQLPQREKYIGDEVVGQPREPLS